MGDLFTRYDRADSMRQMLDHYGIRFNANKQGWQKVRCPYTENHAHGDRNPSGSVNLRTGIYHCHACDGGGDWAQVMQDIEGVGIKEAATLLGLEADENSDDPTGGGAFLF